MSSVNSSLSSVREILAHVGTTMPESILNYPSMTFPEEKAVIYLLAKHHFKGFGRIIDAGLFLGASTHAFATGLRENENPPNSGAVIESYDIAIWVKSMDRYLNNRHVKRVLKENNFQNKIKAKASFEPLLKALLAPHRDLINFHIGDIEKLAKANFPVEIAFYDCLKNYSRDLVAFRAFAPHYVPGHTVVIQQDFFYHAAWDNKIRQEFLAEYFEFVGQFKDTGVFFCVKAIPPEMFGPHDPVLDLSTGQKVELMERAASRASDPIRHIATRLSTVRMLIEAGDARQATERLDALERERASDLTDSLRQKIQGVRADIDVIAGAEA